MYSIVITALYATAVNKCSTTQTNESILTHQQPFPEAPENASILPPKKSIPEVEVSFLKIPLSVKQDIIQRESVAFLHDQAELIPYKFSKKKKSIIFLFHYASARLDDEIKASKISPFQSKYDRVVVFIVTTNCVKGIEYENEKNKTVYPGINIVVLVFDPVVESFNNTCSVNRNSTTELERLMRHVPLIVNEL
jgi:hypothetical protein